MTSVAEIEVEMNRIKNFLLNRINGFCTFLLAKRSWKNLIVLNAIWNTMSWSEVKK